MAGGAPDDTYTWDLGDGDGGPRRAGDADLGGTDLADDDPPPQKGSEPYAGQMNEHGRQLAGLNRVTCGVRIVVRLTGTTPFVYNVMAMATATKLDATSFTVTRSSAGVFRIVWNAGTLPTQTCEPGVKVTGSATYGHGFGDGQWISGNPNGVDVFTFGTTGAAADKHFYVEVF